jgi:hypothetical protein
MEFFKRQLPTLLVLVIGLGLIIQYFIPLQLSEQMLQGATNWYRLIAAFTLVIGIISLSRNHYTKIKRQSAGWGYSLILYIFFILMIFLGFYKGQKGIEIGSPFLWVFNNIQMPLAATTFSLTAFFICSAAYRAFRARTFEAGLMLLAAIIIMVGRIPYGEMLSQILNNIHIHIPGFREVTIPGFREVTSWILNTPGMATRRALQLGIGIGGIATSLRIILGIERTYQGKD